MFYKKTYYFPNNNLDAVLIMYTTLKVMDANKEMLRVLKLD